METETGLLIHPEELDATWIARASALGCTTLALHPRGGFRARETLAEMLAMLKNADYRALLDDAASRGLRIGYQFHAAGYLLPREHFSAHPSWFRMNAAGERVCDCNFCVSSEEALTEVARNARALASRLYRAGKDFYFWLDDKKDAVCHCERCRSLSAADQNLIVMNRILAELRRDDPARTLACLCYQDTLALPTKVRPADGVFLEYAPIERDPHVPCASEDFRRIRPLLDFYGRKNAAVLEYWFDNSKLSDWKKPPKRFAPEGDVIRSDLRFYRDLGFEKIFSFACFLGAEYRALYGEPSLEDFRI